MTIKPDDSNLDNLTEDQIQTLLPLKNQANIESEFGGDLAFFSLVIQVLERQDYVDLKSKAPYALRDQISPEAFTSSSANPSLSLAIWDIYRIIKDGYGGANFRAKQGVISYEEKLREFCDSLDQVSKIPERLRAIVEQWGQNYHQRHSNIRLKREEEGARERLEKTPTHETRMYHDFYFLKDYEFSDQTNTGLVSLALRGEIPMSIGEIVNWTLGLSLPPDLQTRIRQKLKSAPYEDWMDQNREESHSLVIFNESGFTWGSFHESGYTLPHNSDLHFWGYHLVIPDALRNIGFCDREIREIGLSFFGYLLKNEAQDNTHFLGDVLNKNRSWSLNFAEKYGIERESLRAKFQDVVTELIENYCYCEDYSKGSSLVKIAEKGGIIDKPESERLRSDIEKREVTQSLERLSQSGIELTVEEYQNPEVQKRLWLDAQKSSSFEDLVKNGKQILLTASSLGYEQDGFIDQTLRALSYSRLLEGHDLAIDSSGYNLTPFSVIAEAVSKRVFGEKK